jgi:putative SOS response-associated peptidase YedK
VCGRGVVTVSGSELSRLFRAEILDPRLPEASWNVKPTQTIPLVVGVLPERRITPARWSLVPPWSPELKLRFPTFNARSETAAEKPTFRASVINKRCVVPFDGYYEWNTVKAGAVPNSKTPFYIHSSDSVPLFLAGLYSWWRDPESLEWQLTATVLTRASTGDLAAIHDRMPVLVTPEMLDDWLDPDVVGNAQLIEAVSVGGVSELSRLVFDQVAPLRGDGPELIIPVTNSTPSP